MKNILPHFNPNNQHLYLDGNKTPLKVASYMNKEDYHSAGWVAYFSEVEPVITQVTSVVTFRVWHKLLKRLALDEISRNSSTVYVEQKHIAAELGIVENSVTKAIAELKRLGLVITLQDKKRKQVTINPLYAWNGNQKVWQKYVMQLAKQNIIHLPTKEKQ